MEYVYALATAVSFVAWLFVLAFCSRSVFRVILGSSTRRDLITVNTACIAAVFVFGFAVRLLFWNPEAVSQPELVARTIISVLSLVAAVFSFALHYQARRQEPRNQ